MKSKSSNITVGIGTYGTPKVIDYHGKSVVTIGKFCSIAAGVHIITGGNHRSKYITTFPPHMFNKVFNTSLPLNNYLSPHKTIIGNDVWIGYGTIIIGGSTIPDGVIVGAFSVVRPTDKIDPYSIIYGNPAKIIKYRFEKEKIEKLLKLKWWEWPLKKILNNATLLCSTNIDMFIKDV